MQLTISAKQVDISDGLRTHVEHRLTAGVKKYFDRAIDAQVQFARARHIFRSDIAVHAGSGISVRGQGEADDMESAFDIAADRVEKRLRRFKRRLVDHHRAGPTRETQARQVVLAAGEDDGEADRDDAAGGPVTIAETTTSLHTLTVSEAVMRLELAELPVLVFRNSAHGALNVVYRRADGNIGWIDPGEQSGE
jgi:ribosomal subunit interface protein